MNGSAGPDKDALSISSDDECWEAYRAIGHGDEAPLIEFLNRETGTMHPLLQRELAQLLAGVHRNYRLDLVLGKRGAGRPKTTLAAKYLSDKALLDAANPEDEVKHYADPAGEVRRARHRIKKAFDRLKAFERAHAVGKRSKN